MTLISNVCQIWLAFSEIKKSSQALLWFEEIYRDKYVVVWFNSLLLVRFDRFKKSRFGCEKNSFLSGHSALFHFFLRTAGANFEQKYSRIDFEGVLFCIFFRLVVVGQRDRVATLWDCTIVPLPSTTLYLFMKLSNELRSVAHRSGQLSKNVSWFYWFHWAIEESNSSVKLVFDWAW